MTVFGTLPFIPFLHSAEDIIFVGYVFLRFTGLFLISPLFSNRNVPRLILIAITFFSSTIVAATLYPEYRGPDAKYALEELQAGGSLSMLMLVLRGLKELLVGWITGFCFSIVYETLLLGGQAVGVMIGFSVAEMLDPVSGTQQSLISQFFTVSASIFLIILDYHHEFIRVITNSFHVIPIGGYHMPYELMETMSTGTALLFTYAIRVVAIPLVILSLVTIGLGIMARVMPEMNIFMVGFPLRILIGYFGLIATVHFFPVILQRCFIEYYNLANLVVRHIGSGS